MIRFFPLLLLFAISSCSLRQQNPFISEFGQSNLLLNNSDREATLTHYVACSKYLNGNTTSNKQLKADLEQAWAYAPSQASAYYRAAQRFNDSLIYVASRTPTFDHSDRFIDECIKFAPSTLSSEPLKAIAYSYANFISPALGIDPKEFEASTKIEK